jgi:hypothetical protein
VLTVTSYIALVVFLGISAFVAFPAELLFAIIGVYMSQAITFGGYFELVLEKGFFKGTKDFLKMFPALMLGYASLVFNAFFPGDIEAASGGADYVGTGRIWGLSHEAPFDVENPSPAKGKSGELYRYISGRGLPLVIINLIMIGAGIVLWWNLGIIWSFFFITTCTFLI